VIHYLAYCHTL